MNIFQKGKIKKNGKRFSIFAAMKEAAGYPEADSTVRISEEAQARGEAVLTVCDVSTWHARLSEKLVVLAAKLGWKWYRKALAYHHALYARRQYRATNLVVDTGLNLLADALNGDDIEINRVALGDNASAAAAGDTQLGNETTRKAPSSKTVASNEIFVSTFFTASEAVDTHEEVGHFVGGTATTNSGTLYSRIASPDAADLPVTKTNTDSLTIDYKCTFNAS